MQIGVDYYPEHWERAMWEQDAALMQEAGIKIVRVAEFSWSRLEPEEGRYDFAWLDDALRVFQRHGMQVIIGTPTCTPPNWLVKRYPDVLPVDAQRHPRYPGVRGHRCYNSPSLRKFTELIVERLARHYAAHPAVIGWQVDNEFMNNNCNCDNCGIRFREWLKNKYGSLEELNKQWGTVVWSGEYSSWSEVTTPLGGSRHLNPSYLLDYTRFETDSTVGFQQLQLDLLRELCPNHVVTHNIWNYPQTLDFYKLCKNLDFTSFDYYPNTSADKTATNLYSGALSLDLVRGVQRKNFWIMEMLSGPPGGWFPMWRTPQPGFMRAFVWQSISRGADTVVHFRWRSAVMGAEQFWHGLIDHSNVPGRRFEECKQLCTEVNRLSPLLEGTEVRNETAILHSHEQFTALQLQPQAEGFDYYENIKVYHRAFAKLGVGTDVVNWTEELEGYKLVVAPSLYLLDDAVAARLEAFAANGGTLVLTNRTGVKNAENVCWMRQLPGSLARCAGVVVEEYDPIGNDIHHIVSEEGKRYSVSQWADILKPETAGTRARYADDFYAGKPAVTMNRHGKGQVYYIGVNPEEAYFSDLFRKLTDAQGIGSFPNLPEGVQISIRGKDDKHYTFVLNLSKESKTIELGRPYYDLLEERRTEASLTLSPYGVALLADQN